MSQTRQEPMVINVESEIARRKMLLKKPRNQFFLAMKRDEDVDGKNIVIKKVIRLDLDPHSEKSPLVRKILVSISESNNLAVNKYSYEVIFDNEKQISYIKDGLHLHDIYSAIETLRELDPKKNPSINRIIDYLLECWREQNFLSPNLFIHEVKCLADNITCSQSEEIWTLSGPHGSPERLMNTDFSYEGVQQAVKDKHEREIYEKGYSEGRCDALKDLNLFSSKPARKRERSKLEERSYKIG